MASQWQDIVEHLRQAFVDLSLDQAMRFFPAAMSHIEQIEFDRRKDCAEVPLLLGALAPWLDYDFTEDSNLPSVGWLAAQLEAFPKETWGDKTLAQVMSLKLAEGILNFSLERLDCARDELDWVAAQQDGFRVDPRLTSVALMFLSRSYRRLTRYGDALDTLNRVHDHSPELGNLGSLKRINKAWIEFQQGNEKEARDHLLEERSRLSDGLWMGNVESALARIDMRKGRYDAALNEFDAAVGFYAFNSKHRNLARTLINRGFVSFLLAKAGATTNSYMPSSGRAQDTQEPSLEPPRGVSGMLLERASKDLERARSICEEKRQSVPACRRSGSPPHRRGLGMVYVHEALILAFQEHFDKSQKAAEKALEIAESDPLLSARAHATLSMVFNERAERTRKRRDQAALAQSALRHAMAALERAEAAEDPRRKAVACLMVARAYLNLSDLEEASRRLAEAEAVIPSRASDWVKQWIADVRGRLRRQQQTSLRTRLLEGDVPQGLKLEEMLKLIEREIVFAVYQREDGNIQRTAKILGTNRARIRRQIENTRASDEGK